MKPLLLVLTAFCFVLAKAQSTDSLDNIVFNIPKNWQLNKQADYTMLMAFSQDRFCQLAFYQKQAASVDKSVSFEREWSNLVLSSFDAATTVQPIEKKLRNGHSVLSYGVQAVNRNNNQSFYVELNMFNCGNAVQSAVLVSGSKQHLQFFDSSWQMLISKVKTSEDGVVGVGDFPFTGSYGSYNFKPNGTYSYTNESGSYSVIGAQLVIMPARGPRRVYTWQLTGNELILTSTKDQSREVLKK